MLTAAGFAETGAARLVYRSCAVMLLVMAAWTPATGVRTAILPVKPCPIVKTASASLLLIGSVL